MDLMSLLAQMHHSPGGSWMWFGHWGAWLLWILVVLAAFALLWRLFGRGGRK